MVQAEVDGDLVLMSPKDFAYFGTDGVGDEVWELIDGMRTFDDIVSELAHRFDEESAVIRNQSAEFIDALVLVGLVELTP